MSEFELNTQAALQLLVALRAAGSRVYVDDQGDLLVSPPAHRVQWAGNEQQAVDDLYRELRDLVIGEDRGPVH